MGWVQNCSGKDKIRRGMSDLEPVVPFERRFRTACQKPNGARDKELIKRKKKKKCLRKKNFPGSWKWGVKKGEGENAPPTDKLSNIYPT